MEANTDVFPVVQWYCTKKVIPQTQLIQLYLHCTYITKNSKVKGHFLSIYLKYNYDFGVQLSKKDDIDCDSGCANPRVIKWIEKPMITPINKLSVCQYIPRNIPKAGTVNNNARITLVLIILIIMSGVTFSDFWQGNWNFTLVLDNWQKNVFACLIYILMS